MRSVFRSLLTLCVAAALLLSLTACGSAPAQPDTLVGTWDYQFMSPASFGGEDGMPQHLTLILRDDMSFTFGPNTEKMRPEIEKSVDSFIAATIADGSKTAEDFYKENDITREEMVDQLMEMMVNQGSSGTYSTDGDKLFLQFEDTDETPEEYYTYRFSEGRLILTLPEGITPTFQIAPLEEFPLTLTRAA